MPQPLPPDWTRQYGIRSHRIGVSFPGGRMVVRDVAPEDAPRATGGAGG